MNDITKTFLKLVSLGICLLWPMLAFGQFGTEDLAPVTKAYALTNATVVSAPGQQMEGVTILMRNGLIAQMGKNVPIPADVKVIAADSMFVYAGFISGLSQVGTKQPKEEDGGRNRPDNPGSPPNKMAGITPEAQVADVLDPEDNDLEKMRKAGFTAAHVVPHGKMLPGNGAILLFKGEKPQEMLVLDGVSQFVQFEGAGRMYPSTIMGMMAKYRQMYREAEWAAKHENKYAASPEGMQRPEYGNELKAFYPVIEGQKPVFFKASSVLEAHRAMQLQKELGFGLVVAELKEGWDLLIPLQTTGTQVLLSLELPEMMEEEAADSVQADSVEQAQPTEADMEMRALEERKKEAIERRYTQAQQFAEAGMPFGFSTLGAKPNDLLPNLRKMVGMGLDAKAALSALTTTPAQMLGVSRMMGTVEAGKMANLVVSDAPIFTEEAKIRYVFVEGEQFGYDASSAPKADPNATVSVAGTWVYTVESPQGSSGGNLEIAGTPGSFSGSIDSDRMEGSVDLDDIQLSGNQLTFSYTVSAGGRSFEVTTSVVVTGDTFEGTLSLPQMGSFPIEGKRKGAPNRR